MKTEGKATTTIRVMTIAALALLAFAASDQLGFAQATGRLVAVLELANTAGVTDAEADFLTNKVRNAASELLPTAKFTVMTRENIETLLPEGMSLKKCTESKCEIEMGQKLGAEYIVTGEILNYDGKPRVQLKLHHVPTQAYLRGADTPGGTLGELDGHVTTASRGLLAVLLNHAGVPAALPPPPSPGGAPQFVDPAQPAAPAGAAELREIKPSEAPPANASGPAGLYITSNPPGARVFLGTTEAGTTSPAFQKTNLQPGTTVRVTLKLELYRDVSFDVALVPGVQKFPDIALKPAFGALTIESEPSGAKVLIGGKEVGTTPYSNPRQPSGEYLVSLEKEWYAPLSDQTVTIADGQTTKKAFTLSQDFGTLEIASNPPGAAVALNGKALGNAPGSFRVAPVKNGKLEVSLPTYRGKSFEISIDRGQTVKITAEQATLMAKVGSLQVYADPPEPGAKVFLDGKEVGTAPLTLDKVQEGQHEVKVETKNKAGRAVVGIAEAKTAVATVKLAVLNREIWADVATGLGWQVSPTGGRKSWSSAQRHCSDLRLGGYADWRLPTVSELRTLIRGCPETRSDGACGVTDSCRKRSCWNDACKGCADRSGSGADGSFWPPELSGDRAWYWSSSEAQGERDLVWSVGFETGQVAMHVPFDGWFARIRCVRRAGPAAGTAEASAPASPPASAIPSTPAGAAVQARISGIDDKAKIYINGRVVASGEYKRAGEGGRRSGQAGDTGWVDITQYVVTGQNEVRFWLWNDPGCCEVGAHFVVKVGGKTVLDERYHRSDSGEGVKMDKTLSFDYP